MSSAQSKPALRLDWCSHDAATYAVTHWHYSRKMPKSKLAKVGVWENQRFVGAVIFGLGATPELSKPYGLTMYQVAELVRVALGSHQSHVSRIVTIAAKMVTRANPGLRLFISFADTAHGHHGGIYQAAGWIYLGTSFGRYIVTNGRVEHPRTLGSRYGVGGQSLPWLRTHVDPNAKQIMAKPKHRYVFPLDDEIRARIAPLAKPYPKRDRSRENAAPLPNGEGGVIPTRSLQSGRNA